MIDNLYFMILQSTAPTGNKWFQTYGLVAMLVVFIAFYYFVLIRPQSKKRKENEKMLNAIKKGDRVTTIGGIHGKVSNVKDNEVVLKVDANTEIAFDRTAISKVIGSGDSTQKAEKKTVEDKKKK